MAAMQNGDQAAAHDLLKGVRVLVNITARRMLAMSGIRDGALVDDVTQETLLAVYDKRRTYDPEKPFLPWLQAIARYKTIDCLRRSKWRQTTLLDEVSEMDAALAMDTVDPASSLELERLLTALPARSRRAVELVKLQGFTHAEAAAQLGVGEGALKVIVHRALRRLRELMEKT